MIAILICLSVSWIMLALAHIKLKKKLHAVIETSLDFEDFVEFHCVMKDRKGRSENDHYDSDYIAQLWEEYQKLRTITYKARSLR